MTTQVNVRDGEVRLVLCDFGTAPHVATQGHDLLTMDRRGTILLNAPEVVFGGMYSFASDVFSFGLTVHYLLTGQHLQFSNFIPVVTDLRLPTWAVDLVLDCCQFQSENRSSAEQVRDKLGSTLATINEATRSVCVEQSW